MQMHGTLARQKLQKPEEKLRKETKRNRRRKMQKVVNCSFPQRMLRKLNAQPAPKHIHKHSAKLPSGTHTHTHTITLKEREDFYNHAPNQLRN